jgi:hypothetical protein
MELQHWLPLDGEEQRGVMPYSWKMDPCVHNSSEKKPLSLYVS